MMEPCPRHGRWIGGCRFEPRYHVEEPTDELCDVIKKQWSASQADKELLVVKTTYVHDVCVRCGRTAGGRTAGGRTHDTVSTGSNDCDDCDRMDCRERGCIAAIR